MNALIVIFGSCLIYYSGLLFITKKAFKKKKIDIAFSLLVLIPLYILKTFGKIVYDHRFDKKVFKHAVFDMLFGYNIGLTILVEIVVFGVERGHISITEKEKKVSLKETFGTIWKNVKETFSNSLSDYLAY